MSVAPCRATAALVGCLFALYVVAERFAVPGTPVALLLPVTMVILVVAVRRGLVELDRHRVLFWLVVVAATGLVAVVGSAVLIGPAGAPTSWALLLVAWAPMVVRLRRRDAATFELALRHIAVIAGVLAVACIAMMTMQWSGVPYVDLLGGLPKSMLIQAFNTNNPLSYGSPIYKANAWVGLEPSFVSFQLGVGALASVISRRHVLLTALIVVGMAMTFSGSGVIVFAIGIVALAVGRDRQVLRRYLPALAIGLVITYVTPLWGLVFGRLGEFGTPGSSGSLRAVQPYVELWPVWRDGLAGFVLGRGPGASQQLVEAIGSHGLVVTVPIKVFFDYGVLAGGLLAAYMIVCHLGGHSSAVAVALLLGTWSIQPAATVTVLIGQLMMLVTLWSPRSVDPAQVAEEAPPDGVHVPEPIRPVVVPAPRRQPRHAAAGARR